MRNLFTCWKCQQMTRATSRACVWCGAVHPNTNRLLGLCLKVMLRERDGQMERIVLGESSVTQPDGSEVRREVIVPLDQTTPTEREYLKCYAHRDTEYFLG